MDAYQNYLILRDLSVLFDHGDRLALRPFNLSPLQYNTLLLLDTEDGRRLTDLSERLMCERSTVTRLVDYLESEGLVRRVADPDDRRSQRVTLTLAGMEKRNAAQAAFEDAIKQRFSVLSQEEQQQLFDFHQQLRDVLHAEIDRSSKEPADISSKK